MPAVYTTVEKVQIVKWYFGGHSIVDTINLFIVAFQDRPIPTHTAVSYIIKKFENFGCVVNYCKKCCQPEPRHQQMSEEREIRETNVCALVENSEPCSSRQIADEVDMKERTVRNILKRNGYSCFKVQTTQEIFPEDNFKRMEFCETMVNKINVNENFLNNILFTDESSFSLHRKHNPSVVRYWSRENKHLSVAVRTQYPQKLNVWTGILGNHIIGPLIIDGNLNGNKYLELLENQIIPAVQNLPVNFDNIWFQQDGCPSHNKKTVITFLETTFPNHLIATRGMIKWPPRSPDLAPHDFFLWGCLKETAYKHAFERATNLVDLREKLIQLCANITPNQLNDMRVSLYNRFGYCLAQEGGLFEPLIH